MQRETNPSNAIILLFTGLWIRNSYWIWEWKEWIECEWKWYLRKTNHKNRYAEYREWLWRRRRITNKNCYNEHRRLNPSRVIPISCLMYNSRCHGKISIGKLHFMLKFSLLGLNQASVVGIGGRLQAFLWYLAFDIQNYLLGTPRSGHWTPPGHKGTFKRIFSFFQSNFELFSLTTHSALAPNLVLFLIIIVEWE